MLTGPYKRVYANKKVQELKEELYRQFLKDLRFNKNEIEVLLYFTDEEQRYIDDEGESFKYKIKESLFGSSFFLVNSLKQAILKYPRINSSIVNYTKLEDYFKEKKYNAYEKEVDGIKCVFAKIHLSNRDRKKLLSGKYCIDMNHLFRKEKNITEVFLIHYLLIRYK